MMLATVGQGLSRVVGVLLGAVVSIGLARGLGRTDFGWVALALTVTGFAGLAGDLGIGQAATRDIAAEPERAPTLAGAVLAAKLLAAIPVLVVALVGSVAIPGNGPRIAFIAIIGSLLLAGPCSLSAVLAAHLRPGLVGLTNLAQSVIWAAVVVVCALTHAGVAWYGAGFTASYVVQAAWTLERTLRLQPISIAGWWSETRSLLSRSWTIGGAAVFFSVYQRGPLLVLQAFHGIRYTALLGAAFRFVDAAMVLLPATLNGTLIPIISPILREGRSVRRLIQLALGFSVAIGVGTLAVVAPVSERLGRLLLSNQFRGIGTPFVIGLVAFVAFCLDTVWGGALIAAGRGKVLATSAFASLVVSLAVAVATVPTFGVPAAAFAALAGQALRSYLLGRDARDLGGELPVRSWVGSAVAGAIACLCGFLARSHLPLVAVMSLDGVVYAALCIALQGVRLEDLSALGLPVPAGLLRLARS